MVQEDGVKKGKNKVNLAPNSLSQGAGKYEMPHGLKRVRTKMTVGLVRGESANASTKR